MMKPFLFQIALSLLLAVSASHASTLSDGVQAFQDGDHWTALEILKPLAKGENTEAYWYYAELAYRLRLMDPKNKSYWTYEAARWYRKAAESGHLEWNAQLSLWRSRYDFFEDKDTADKESIKWLLKAAEHHGYHGEILSDDVADAYIELASIKDYGKAVIWLKRAAEEDFYYHKKKYWKKIGDLYYEGGHGLRRDSAEALQWYLMAAKVDGLDSATKRKISQMYLYGNGVQMNAAEAKKWEEAADKLP